MPIDTSIYGQIQAPKFESPLNSLATVLPAIEALQKNKLMQQQVADTETLNNLYRSSVGADGSIDRAALFSGAASGGLGSKIPGMMKQFADVDKEAAAAKKTGFEAANLALTQHRAMLNNVNDPETAKQWLIAAYQNPDTKPIFERFGPMEEALRRFDAGVKDPASFAKWKQGASLNADELVKYTTPDANTVANNKQQDINNRRTVGVQYARLDYDKSQPKGQIVQTDQGPMLVDPRDPNSAKPLTAGGQPLGSKLKDIPASVNTAIVSNMQNMNKAQAALDLIQGKKVGTATGDKEATGWKGMLPNTVLNRLDESGVDTRAAIADLGSMVLHERSGAAVTAAESPRLMPFIPLATDDAKTAEKKLKRFVEIYKQEAQALGEIYSKEQGYKPNPISGRTNASAPPAGGKPSLDEIFK